MYIYKGYSCMTGTDSTPDSTVHLVLKTKKREWKAQ